MAVLLTILLFAIFIGIDFVLTRYVIGKGARMSRRCVGTQFTTPGYECLGALAQDGGKPIKK